NLNFSFIKNSNFIKAIKNQKLEKEIIKLSKLTKNRFELLLWVRHCLMYFHKFEITHSKQIELNMINEIEDGLEISFRNEIFWIPKINNFFDISQEST
ncbi:hypothetical protein ACF8NW_14900, partial [Acinetobacter soli]